MCILRIIYKRRGGNGEVKRNHVRRQAPKTRETSHSNKKGEKMGRRGEKGVKGATLTELRFTRGHAEYLLGRIEVGNKQCG